jgi:hypothetical protein
MMHALKILTLLTLSSQVFAKTQNSTAFAIVPHKSVQRANRKPSFYYQSFAFERKETFDKSWAKPFYVLLNKAGYKMNNYQFENGVTAYVPESEVDAQPFFEIGVTLKGQHPNIDIKTFSQAVLKGYTATYIGKVKKADNTVPDFCKIPDNMRKTIYASEDNVEFPIDKNSRVIFRRFALPISNDAFWSFTEQEQVPSDGVWVSVIQVCSRFHQIRSQFVDNKVGDAVNTGSNVYNAPWIEASVKILGHNPHGYLSADMLWTVPFNMFLAVFAIGVSIAFAALATIHRKNALRYHWILLVCTFLTAAYIASLLRSDIASNTLAKNHFAHAPLASEKADAILRTLLATGLRFALGLFALGYAHLDGQSRNGKDLVIMCAILTAFAGSFAIWQMQFERVSHVSSISPWMFVCALVDASYMYFLLEKALSLMQKQRKEQQFAKLALYKRVAAIIIVVVVCQALSIAIRLLVPFEKLSLRPQCWPVCMLLGPSYDTILLLFALSAALILLRPHKHSKLYRESREVPLTTTNKQEPEDPKEPQGPIAKFTEQYHNDYQCMA